MICSSELLSLDNGVTSVSIIYFVLLARFLDKLSFSFKTVCIILYFGPEFTFYYVLL